MSMRLSHVALQLLTLFLICCCLSFANQASDLSDLQTKLRSQYCGRVVTLRSLLPGDQLDFSSLGHPTINSEPDSWTTSGEINLTDLHLANDQLQLRGRRIFLLAKEKKNFEALFPGSAAIEGGIEITDPGKKKYKKLEKLRPVTITVQLQPGMSEADIRGALDTVFLKADEQILDVVPASWKPLLSPPQSGGTSKSEQDVCRVGNGVAPPHALYAPDPEYSEIARKAHLQGTTVLWLIVDATGLPRDIRIARAIGLGLDDQAVRAVSQWKFDPATKGKTPVAVQINVEVTFRLY